MCYHLSQTVDGDTIRKEMKCCKYRIGIMEKINK